MLVPSTVHTYGTDLVQMYPNIARATGCNELRCTCTATCNERRAHQRHRHKHRNRHAHPLSPSGVEWTRHTPRGPRHAHSRSLAKSLPHRALNKKIQSTEFLL